VAFEKFGDHLIEVSGFAAMAEMLIKFRQIPLFMTEVPMIIRYDLKGRASKMRVMATIQEHLGVIARNLFKRRVYRDEAEKSETGGETRPETP
jgi:hypothetical protein